MRRATFFRKPDDFDVDERAVPRVAAVAAVAVVPVEESLVKPPRSWPTMR